MSSVWELSKPGVLAELHPQLKQYFSEIPAGQIARGAGYFEWAGSPRRWLWPFLAVLGKDQVLFPAWQQRVRFEIENEPRINQHGQNSILARRTFYFERGARTMLDEITAERYSAPGSSSTDHLLIDYLGRSRRLAATLQLTAEGGALRVNSTAVSLRCWGHRFELPRCIAPRIELTERFDELTGLQSMSLKLFQPQLGLLYEYSGSFRYWLEPAEGRCSAESGGSTGMTQTTGQR
ncbi:DUF4166 domain-containing protein [Psychromicrobium sp. YIM B11713]|uniref:DUF4166 domain-containing protein n=1 Tax=Psychromicrobium sp. YIM B11713 TaxID=3145233 RepID=UPI00374F1079